jgi:hypothetical protein
MKIIIELLKAWSASRRKDIHAMFRHTATAFLSAPKRYKLSDAGDSLLYATMMLWTAHRYYNDPSFRKERFFADLDGFDRELLLHILLMIPLSLAKPSRNQDDLKRAANHYMRIFGITTTNT